MTTRPQDRTVLAAQRGITLLETMIVLAIIGLGMSLGYSAYRKLTRADLVEDTNHLGALMARASELAGESGKLHRVTIDFDEGTAVVESCEGLASIRRPRPGDKVVDDKEAKRALDDARGRLKGTRSDPVASKMMAMQTPEDETKMAAALAGHHVGDQTCTPVKDVWSGDAEGRPLIVKLKKDRGIKAREVWVQHRDDSVTSGQVSIFFFPLGSAEKAIVELTDGTETYSVRVHGLTGEIETVDGEVKDVEDFMHKDITGEREAPR